MIAPRAALGTLFLLLSVSLPVSAETCTPLNVVGGEGTEVTKRVSAPSLPIGPFGLGFRNNWNTDFAVPNNASFKKYIVTIKSESTAAANFPVSMFLKYSDDTADETYKGNVELSPGQSRELSASPRIGEQPYQVNLNIGSLGSKGFTYTLSVRACR